MKCFYSPSGVSIAKISVAVVAIVVTIAAYDRCFDYADYYCEYPQGHYCGLDVTKHKLDLH